MAEDLGERTEEATPKRRQEERQNGNVPRSQDLSGAMTLLLITVTLWAAAATMIWQGSSMLGQALDGDTLGSPLWPADAGELTRSLAVAALRIAAPILLVAWAVAFLSHLVQIGWLFSPKAVQPNLSKLSPISGFKRIFGLRGLVKATMDALKVAVVVAVAAWTIAGYAEPIVLLPVLAATEALAEVGRMLLVLALRVVAVLLLLGLLDFLFQRWKYAQDLKMTKQQVKDEMKQTDGDPEVKKRRMRMQQQMAMQRIGAAVPTADVIVTNPEHISVAIRYDADNMHAPRVVAKGADYLALRIRQIALRHGIPIVERKPLARALYRQVEVGQEVPPQFYQAVAEILAYVYRLNGTMAG